MKIKIGNTYRLNGKCVDVFGNTIPKDMTVIVTEEDNSIKVSNKGAKTYRVFSVSEGTVFIVPESSLSSRLNAETILELKDFHKKNITALEDIETCLKSMQVESITEEEYLVFKALEVQSKVGATSSQKVKALKLAMSAL